MTRRERLTRCYCNQETDRPAVYSRTGFPPDDPTYDRLRAYLAEHSELKVGWPGGGFESAYPVETFDEPYSEDFSRRREILHTPRGDLTRTFLAGRKGQPGLHETYFIQSVEDANIYLSLPMPRIGGDVSSWFAADTAVGDAGIVDIDLGLNPGGFAVELCGSETFAILSVTSRDILHRLCERRMSIMLEVVAFLLDSGIGPFFSMLGEEYIVPPLHGPKDFVDFNVRYDKPIIDRIHDGGGRVHVHSHGSIKSVFQGFIDMGADVLHPFEPPPQGDITAREAKDAARGKLCLEGNIQIYRMYEATPDDIRRETAHLIDTAFDDHRGLIVCPSASPYIPGQGDICFPQYKAMVDTVLGSTV
jgi:hypothetical protein